MSLCGQVERGQLSRKTSAPYYVAANGTKKLRMPVFCTGDQTERAGRCSDDAVAAGKRRLRNLANKGRELVSGDVLHDHGSALPKRSSTPPSRGLKRRSRCRQRHQTFFV